MLAFIHGGRPEKVCDLFSAHESCTKLSLNIHDVACSISSVNECLTCDNSILVFMCKPFITFFCLQIHGLTPLERNGLLLDYLIKYFTFTTTSLGLPWESKVSSQKTLRVNRKLGQHVVEIESKVWQVLCKYIRNIYQKKRKYNIYIYIQFLYQSCWQEAIQYTRCGLRSGFPTVQSLACSQQPFCIDCIYFACISYIFVYISCQLCESCQGLTSVMVPSDQRRPLQ